MRHSKNNYFYGGGLFMTAAQLIYPEWFVEYAPYAMWVGVDLIISTLILDLRDHFKKSSASNLIFASPKHKYSLVWDPPHNLQIITRPDLLKDEASPNTRLPVFRLKNLSENVIRDIKIDWVLPEHFISDEMISSKIFEGLEVKRSDNFLYFTQITEGSKNESCCAVSLNETQKQEWLQPHSANDDYTDIVMPSPINSAVEIAIISKFNENPPILATYITSFEVKVSYKENDISFKDKYTVTCTAKSIKPQSNGIVKIPINGKMREPPLVMASLKFDVKK